MPCAERSHGHLRLSRHRHASRQGQVHADYRGGPKRRTRARRFHHQGTPITEQNDTRTRFRFPVQHSSLHVVSESPKSTARSIHSTSPWQKSKRLTRGIVLSGGPASVYQENAPKVDAGVFICPCLFSASVTHGHRQLGLWRRGWPR